MITLKYEKTSSAVYISHIDLLRNFVRILRRTGIKIEFSQGFNPHMLLFFSPPMAVGVASTCEYVTVGAVDVTAEEFLAAFNRCASEGLKGVSAYYSEKSPNLAGKITQSDYLFPIKNAEYMAKLAEFFANCKEYYIEYTQKKELIRKEVSSQIKGVKVVENGVEFTLATGNDNLRADRLLLQLKKDFGLETEVTDILKIKQYVGGKDGIIEVDKLLAGGIF